MKKKQLLFALLAFTTGLGTGSSGLAAAPTNAEVGDADSFGKRAEWIGMLQTAQVVLTDNCTGFPNLPPPADQCVVLNGPGVPTTVAFVDLGHVTLPKDSTDDFICHWISPNGFVEFSNPTAAPVLATFRTAATYRIESVVLQDPALINPQTGLPFNGFIDVPITMHSELRTLAAGAFDSQQTRASRTCIAGLVSKSSLIVDYGLTDALAKKFFKEPITIRAGITATANWVSNASILYGTRLTGDHK